MQQNLSQNDEMEELSQNNYEAFTDIERLSDFYTNVADLKKTKRSRQIIWSLFLQLKFANLPNITPILGFCTTKSLVMNTKKDLQLVKGITEQKIKSLLDALKKFDQANGNGGSMAFQSGLQVHQQRKYVIKLHTGSPELDQMLGGGVESQSITEVYGEFRSGKTQLAHTLAVTAQLSKKEGGGQGKVLYIDTEGTFRPERILPIAERFGLEGEHALENILHARAFSVEHMQELLSMAQKLIAEEGPFALIIVDSIMALFRIDFSGRGELSERQQVLGKTMATLSKMADQFNISVFITNQIMADPSGMSFGDNRKPIGGNVLAHASTTRVYLKKGSKEERIATLVDSPYCKEATVKYKITDSGIGQCIE